MIKFVTLTIGTVALFFNSVTSLSSCFWFAYEPELPENRSKE
ncbi:cyclic lactone autoinducer peptide (plasmid) [Bacillus sp. F19]|nr:cyclic lactone autoinducer peptide [Bacillus sp. F19]